MKKIIVFGSCQTGGLELWHEKHLSDFKTFNKVTSALKTDFNENYVKVIQNKKKSELAKEQIEYGKLNAWPSQLKFKYPDADISNFAVSQSNIANFIKISTYLDSVQLDQKETKIIIEITDPVGITSVRENMLRSYDKEALKFWLSKEESVKMGKYIDTYEPPRFRAYLELLMAKNLISDLRSKGFDVDYFVWDRSKWIYIIENTSPFEMFLDYENYITDNFKNMMEEFLKGTLLKKEQEIELNSLPKLPQEHFSHTTQALLGKFICDNLK
jgi:hypothetical protein